MCRMFLGLDCPTDQGPFCELAFSVDAAPTCVSSDCVLPGPPPPENENVCGPCSVAIPGFGCPSQEADEICNYQTSTEVCEVCDADTGCPGLSEEENQACFDMAAGTRRLEMGHEEWGFKKFGLGFGL